MIFESESSVRSRREHKEHMARMTVLELKILDLLMENKIKQEHLAKQKEK